MQVGEPGRVDHHDKRLQVGLESQPVAHVQIALGAGRFEHVRVLRRPTALGVRSAAAALLDLAVERLARIAPRAGLKLAEAERLPFKDASFDRVTFVLSVHLVDRPGAFAEARRVLTTRTAGEVSRMLEGVFGPGGTASEAKVPGYRLAGSPRGR